MPATKVTRMTILMFRSQDLFSGAVHVSYRSKPRGEARQHGRASCNSLEHHAETVDACLAGDGESAPTSAAHAAICEADAVLADSKADEAARASQSKKAKTKPESVLVLRDDADSTSPAASAPGSGGEHPEDLVEALWKERYLLDGGNSLPTDRPGFVDAVNAHIDMVRATELMLRGRDEKSTKSLLELLLEMKYGVKHAANAKGPSPLDRLPPVLRD